MPKLLSHNRSVENRALQIWQILVGKALNRQTMTYGLLADALGYKGLSALRFPLGRIMNYCDVQGLPPLTVLVVNQNTGVPGQGLTTSIKHNVDRERVFRYKWYDLYPPTPADFSAAPRSSK